jgi:hypothetical protein
VPAALAALTGFDGWVQDPSGLSPMVMTLGSDGQPTGVAASLWLRPDAAGNLPTVPEGWPTVLQLAQKRAYHAAHPIASLGSSSNSLGSYLPSFQDLSNAAAGMADTLTFGIWVGLADWWTPMTQLIGNVTGYLGGQVVGMVYPFARGSGLGAVLEKFGVGEVLTELGAFCQHVPGNPVGSGGAERECRWGGCRFCHGWSCSREGLARRCGSRHGCKR